MRKGQYVMCDVETFLRKYPGFELINPAFIRELRGDPNYQVRYIEEKGRILMLEFGYPSDVWRLNPPFPAT